MHLGLPIRLALLGDPVSHSLSPAIHRVALATVGIEGSYEARTVDELGVRNAFEEVRDGRLTGFNVTMPFKALAATLCDELDPDAARAASVNTVTRIGDRIKGYSTDIGGIRDAWDGLPEENPVLILGAGGAASAACVALADRPLYLAARTFGVGTELGERLGLEIGEVRWGVPVVEAVVVNCTPLGMGDEELPADVLSLAAGLLDMAYGPRPTPAVMSMRSLGYPVVEGVDLLLAQAARSFEIWTGRSPPLAAMRKAVKSA
jgi:shikimate dehydrogenase